MNKKYRSEACAVIHEIMEGFYEDGLIDGATMEKFNEGCLVQRENTTISVHKKYRSDAAAAIHEIAEGLYDGGFIDKAKMKQFDESCLLSSDDIEMGNRNQGRENSKDTE